MVVHWEILVLEDGELFAEVEDGSAIRKGDAGGVRMLQLACASEADDRAPVPIGAPQQFELDPLTPPAWPPLTVTPDECRAALALLRKPG